MMPSVEVAESVVTGLINVWSETERWYRNIVNKASSQKQAYIADAKADCYKDFVGYLKMLQQVLRGEDIKEAEE